MVHAYDEIYVAKGQTALGQMLRYAVEDLGMGLNEYFDMFLLSGVADLFGKGDYRYLVGMSGIEISYEVFWRLGKALPDIRPSFSLEKSSVYWAGWALAWYQWYAGEPFRLICEYIKPDQIEKMYIPYHEMDLRQFYDAVQGHRRHAGMITRLRAYRERMAMSQSELAAASGTSVRMIQHYEQRRKDINHAQAQTLYSLAAALHCSMEELLEPAAYAEDD